MANEIKLGQLAKATDGRDAIHIATAAVMAAENLCPGDHVALNDDKQAYYSINGIGIVDPFLRTTVNKGEWFFLCLYPYTITSLRHVWTHPAFITKVEVPACDERMRFVAEITLNPHDELPHRKYADWLEARGEYEEASKHRGWTKEKAKSEIWLRSYASHVCPYDGDNAYEAFIERALAGEIFYHGTDCHGYHDVSQPDELFHHLSIILGRNVQPGSFTYSCSC